MRRPSSKWARRYVRKLRAKTDNAARGRQGRPILEPWLQRKLRAM